MSEHYEVFDEPGVREFKAFMADPAARQAFVELKRQKADRGARNSYEHVIRAVSGSPWAVREDILRVIPDLRAFQLTAGAFELEARIGAARGMAGAQQTVAVLPVRGIVTPRMDLFTALLGGTSMSEFRSAFRGAMAAKDVSAIVLDVDSPGGMVDQVPEMAAEIRSARGKKPIVAVANTEANSAAYWLASQADEIVASPSSLMGSIGTYAQHVDESQAEAIEGVKTTLVSAGKFKTEANPHEPLGDEAAGHLQGLVDNYYGMFVADVAKGRGVSVDNVRNGYGEGRVLSAKDAVSEGLADRVGTFDDVVRELMKGEKPAGRLAAMQPALEAPHLALVEDVSGELPEIDEELEGLKAQLLALSE
jgi:signal peptide peptidase SppA